MNSGPQDQTPKIGNGSRRRSKVRETVRRIRTSSIGIFFAFLVGAIVALASTFDAADRLLVRFKIVPDALQLGHEDARSKFSRDLLRAAWGRWFLMQRYISAVEVELSSEDKSKIWVRYLEARDEWNRDLMVNILSIGQFYGADKRELFEGPIQSAFGSIHLCLASLHYDRPSISCAISTSRNVKEINRAHERLNRLLYCFATGLSDRDKAISDCRSFMN
jgi:hypothetical protein